jgi:hypothetical protein
VEPPSDSRSVALICSHASGTEPAVLEGLRCLWIWRSLLARPPWPARSACKAGNSCPRSRAPLEPIVCSRFSTDAPPLLTLRLSGWTRGARAQAVATRGQQPALSLAGSVSPGQGPSAAGMSRGRSSASLTPRLIAREPSSDATLTRLTRPSGASPSRRASGRMYCGRCRGRSADDGLQVHRGPFR